MEQSLVENVAVANEAAQGDTASGNEEVYLSDLNVGSESGGTVEPAAQTDEPAMSETRGDGAAQPDNPKPNQNYGTPKDFSAALNKRVAEIQAKYESSDEYAFGRTMLQDRASREGISIQEARRRYENERVSSQADEYKRDPGKFYEDFIRGRFAMPAAQEQAPHTQTQPQSIDPNVIAQEGSMIASQIVKAKQNGVLPDTFSPADMTPEFIENVYQHGMREAASRWAANAQQPFVSAASVADELERRRTAPRPMRPASQGGNVGGSPNFSSMSDEQFKKYDAFIEKSIMEGKRVRF